MTGFPLELGIGARGQKTIALRLSDGQKSFKTGLAHTQYRRVTSSHPAIFR